MKTLLYSVTGYEGAHVLLSVRATETGEIADVQFIGAPLPFSTPRENVRPYTQAAAVPGASATIEALAQEAVTVYELEPLRVQRAAELFRGMMSVQMARRNFLGESITPSLKIIMVKGSTGWYTVSQGACTCEDHRRGHVCKHRIAAWMYRESIIRPHAQARRVDKAVIMAELGA